MRRARVAVGVLAALIGGVAACTNRAAPIAGPSTPSHSLVTQPPIGTPGASGVFHLDADRAANVAVTVAFLNAYNGGDLDAALQALGPDPGLSDCDYSRQGVVDLHGRAQVASWLKERFDDHSRIVWSEIYRHCAVHGRDQMRRASLE